MPKVSIVIALHNYARYVAETLRSIQKQTVKDWEVVIVDDASTDNPYPVVRPFLSDSRFKFHSLSSNVGVSAARNIAIRRSEGSFIAFVDADDMLTKKSLALRLKALSKTKRLWVHGRVYNLKDGKLTPDTDFHNLWVEFNKQAPDPITKYSKSVHSQSVLVQREFYKKIGMFDEELRYAEEQDVWKRAVSFGYMPAYVSDFVAIYRYHKKQTRFQPGARELKKRCLKLSAERLALRLKEGINPTNTILLEN
jgi:glycosyltransferase involved in cell wall biosynthesis